MNLYLHLQNESPNYIIIHDEGGSAWLTGDSAAASRALVLKVALHAADISNPAKPWDYYMKWTDRVLVEFFQQVKFIIHNVFHCFNGVHSFLDFILLGRGGTG